MTTMQPGETADLELPAAKGELIGRPDWRLSAADVASLVVEPDGRSARITAGRETGTVDVLVVTTRQEGDETREDVSTIGVKIAGKPVEQPPAPVAEASLVSDEDAGAPAAPPPAPKGRKARAE